MACCHELSIINDQHIGDPLDVKIFEGSGWTLEEGNKKNMENYIAVMKPPKELALEESSMSDIGIIKRFEFNSAL